MVYIVKTCFSLFQTVSTWVNAFHSCAEVCSRRSKYISLYLVCW